MAESNRWLHDYTAELFDGGLSWCDGARELLEALAAEGTPMVLGTNTQRALTDRSLRRIGPHCAAELLTLLLAACLAIEDSITGTAAAESAEKTAARDGAL